MNSDGLKIVNFAAYCKLCKHFNTEEQAEKIKNEINEIQSKPVLTREDKNKCWKLEKEIDEVKDICNYCLQNPTNLYSMKPVNFEEK